MKRVTDDYTVVLGRNNINTQLTLVMPQLQDLVCNTLYTSVYTVTQYLYIYWAPLRCSAPRCLVTKEKHCSLQTSSGGCRV